MPSPELQRRFDQGRSFEDGAVANLEAVAADVVVTTAETEEELEACTAAAIESEVSVIVGGRLPTDVEGRRVGKPDLLVAAGDGAYRPVDVKHHMALEPNDGAGRGLSALCSELARPLLDEAAVRSYHHHRRHHHHRVHTFC